MSENKDNLENIIRPRIIKYNFAFLGIILGSLALSFQYSPKLGNSHKWLLIASWILYFISGFLGFYRNFRSLKNDYEVLFYLDSKSLLEHELRESNKLLNELKDKMAEQSIEENEKHFKTIKDNVEKLKSDIVSNTKYLKKRYEEIKKRIPDIKKPRLIWTTVQFYSYISALFINGLFITLNYIN